MTDDINNVKQPFDILLSPSDVCTLLNIKESTLRKYAILLQNAGYQFRTNAKGSRDYLEQDVIVIKRLIEVKNNRDMTLESAVNSVLAWVKESSMAVTVIDKDAERERYGDDIKELKEMVVNQSKLLKDLMEQLHKQQKYIDERLEQRDSMLMQSLREVQETKKLMIAAEEEKKIASEEEKKKRKGILRFFGK